MTEPFDRWYVQFYRPKVRKDKWRTIAAGPAFWARWQFDYWIDHLEGTECRQVRLIRQDGTLAAEFEAPKEAK